jgi:hypothetical protein
MYDWFHLRENPSLLWVGISDSTDFEYYIFEIKLDESAKYVLTFRECNSDKIETISQFPSFGLAINYFKCEFNENYKNQVSQRI